MELLIFNCLTPGGICEWFHLKDFVKTFNDIYSTSYSRSKCLDVYGPDNKQPAQAPKRPEVLLESDGEVPIVIERKAVVWPSTFQRDHSKEHELLNSVAETLGEQFGDSAYELTFYADDLKGLRKAQVEEYAKRIARLIVSNSDRSKSARGISARSPVRWAFRPLAPHELDESDQASGIRSHVESPSPWNLEPLEFQQSSETALAGFAERFDREARKAGRKFDEHTDCKKLLVVQFFGDGDYVTDEEVISMIKAAQLPKQIDQVWLTGREPVSLDDHDLAWERVR